MRIAFSRAVLLGTGLALLLAALLTALAEPVGAAPAMLVTETPTAEPPTRTSTPTSTTGLITATPTHTQTSTAVPPGSTPTATATTTAATATGVPPTSEPPGDDDTPVPTATAVATATATATPITQIADPAITKSASVSTAQVGDIVEFTITVSNHGNAPADDVVVEDALPAFLTLEGVSATRGEVSVSGTTVRVVIGTLAPGEEVTITITARVVASAAPPNNSNIATVSTSSETDDPGNNSSSVSLLINQPPPASLPNTGDSGGHTPLALAALGLLLIAASLITRRRQA